MIKFWLKMRGKYLEIYKEPVEYWVLWCPQLATSVNLLSLQLNGWGLQWLMTTTKGSLGKSGWEILV